MKYILRKFLDASTVEEALALDGSTPVHDAYLKEGEEPRRSDSSVSAVAFALPRFGDPAEAARKK